MEKQKTIEKIVDLHSAISGITLIINDQNIPVKRQKLEFKKEQDSNICYLEETYFKYKNTNRANAKQQEKIYYTIINHKH